MFKSRFSRAGHWATEDAKTSVAVPNALTASAFTSLALTAPFETSQNDVRRPRTAWVLYMY